MRLVAVGPAKTITTWNKFPICEVAVSITLTTLPADCLCCLWYIQIGTGRVAMIRTPIKGVINASDLHARRFSDEDALTTITFMEMFMIVQIQFQSLCPHTTA